MKEWLAKEHDLLKEVFHSLVISLLHMLIPLLSPVSFLHTILYVESVAPPLWYIILKRVCVRSLLAPQVSFDVSQLPD